MEVFLGPTYTIDVSSPPAPPSRLFQMEDGGAASVSSASSSSIGEPGDSDEEEVSSHNPLGSLASLEDSLPVKKGLSNNFSGKSKSFANLWDASTAATAKDLEKVENPLNKKRRVLIACKWSRKSSFYGWHQNPKSMPLLALAEDDDDHQHTPRQQPSPPSSSSDRDEERPVANGRALHRTISKLQGKRSFKSASCFALSDLVHLDDDDDQING